MLRGAAMPPLKDISQIHPGVLLYHSIFGVAQVAEEDADGWQLKWDSNDSRLPLRLSRSVAKRDKRWALYGPDDRDDAESDTELPLRWSAAPFLAGRFQTHALALAEALATHHEHQRVVNPNPGHIRVMPDNTFTITPARPPLAGAVPPHETFSPATDVFLAAQLLLHRLLGRALPSGVEPHALIPILRESVGSVPPSALAPLEQGLQPLAVNRPSSGIAWSSMWAASAHAETQRERNGHQISWRHFVGYDTHVGRAKALHTQVNQDRVLISQRGPLSLMVVCDGISTSDAGSGDIASDLACQTIADLWHQVDAVPADPTPGQAVHFLHHALRLANSTVCEAARRFAGGELTGRVPMGTTVVAAIAYGNRIDLAWLGDSRAYIVGQYGASLLTSDHNQQGVLFNAWSDNRSGLRWLEAGHALVRYIGHFDDVGQPRLPPLSHASFTMNPDETLVLCTDGITDFVDTLHAQVAQHIAAADRSDPDQLARTLVNLANRGGGGDNASVVAMQLVES